MALSYNLCLTSNIHFINYRKAFIIRCLSYYTKCDIRGSNAIFNTILHCHEKKKPAKCNYLSSRKMFLPTHTYKCTCRVCKNVYQRIIFYFIFSILDQKQNTIRFIDRTAKRVLFIDSMQYLKKNSLFNTNITRSVF